MTEIQRYATVTSDGFQCFTKHPDGNAVLYSDHLSVVQQLEAERDEFNAGWKSCIEDLRKSAEICRQAETRVRQFEQRIGRLREVTERLIVMLEATDTCLRTWNQQGSPVNVDYGISEARAALKESE